MFEARLERSKQLANERGDATRTQTGVGRRERNRPGTACAANNAKAGAGSWQETDDQATEAMFQCPSSPRCRLGRAPLENEQAEEEPAFAKLVYLQGGP
jgi:hypothetical protein